MVIYPGRIGGRRVSRLILLFYLFASLNGGHDLGGPSLVRWVVEKSTNILNEQRVEQFGDLLFIGEGKCSVVSNPVFWLPAGL